MDIEQAAQMCKALECVAEVRITISEDGRISIPKIHVFTAKRKDILAYRSKHGLPNITKKYYSWIEDIDWNMDNVTFNKVEVCRVVGHKTVHHEAKAAYDEQKPIYECTNAK